MQSTLSFCIYAHGFTTRLKEKRIVYMSRHEEYEKRTEELLNPLMEENNFELVDVEYVKEAGNWYLRAYIDKEGGITLDDCELINRALSDIMDKEDFISGSYILEVSSPGLGRQLKKDKDFRRSIGSDVEVKLYKTREIPSGRNGRAARVKELKGILKAFTDDTITIETDFSDSYEIPRAEISIVRLAIDF